MNFPRSLPVVMAAVLCAVPVRGFASDVVEQLPNAPVPQESAKKLATEGVQPEAGPQFQMTKVAGYEMPQAGPAPLRLTLDDAIRIGLAHNLQSQINRQNQRAVGGLQLTALNALIPSLTADLQTSTQEINLAAMGFNPSAVGPLLQELAPGLVFNTIVKVDVTSAQVNLAQQVFNLPAFEIYRASKHSAQVATFNALLNRGDVVQNVGTQYLKILSDVDAIHNAESQLKADREVTRQADEQHKAGVGTNLDYLRARVEEQQQEQQLIQAQNDFDKDKIQLNRMMGIPADQPLELTDAIPYHELEQLPVEEAKRVAAVRRKDLLSIEEQLRSAELQRKAIKFERLPVASVNGFYGVLGETRGLYHGVFTVVGGVDFPIFQEARIRGDEKISDAQLTVLRQRIAGLQTDIEQQIRAAKLDVDSYSELVKVARSNVDLAREELRETTDRYRAGVDDDLPVVQAQATLADAQAQLVASLYQFNGAKLALARSIGVVETQYQGYLGK